VLKNNKKAIVITPSTGSKYLRACHQSILDQSYNNLEHLVVVDGKDFLSKTKKQLKNFSPTITSLPYNTGSNGYYGHRIYAAIPHILNCDYIFFLDEDNWLDKNHVQYAIREIESLNIDWCFSLRNIFEEDESFVVKDNCESLGPWSPVGLVDTSAYAFRSDFIRKHCHIWDHGWGADRRFFFYLQNYVKESKYSCTGKYTLNYRLGGNENSVKKDFFISGNAKVKQKYEDNYPWIKN